MAQPRKDDGIEVVEATRECVKRLREQVRERMVSGDPSPDELGGLVDSMMSTLMRRVDELSRTTRDLERMCPVIFTLLFETVMPSGETVAIYGEQN